MTPQPAPHLTPAIPQLDPCAAQIASAERELGAFLAAVQEKFGTGAAQQAASYWIEIFEAVDESGLGLRAVTIAAASRLAKSLEAV